MNALKLSAFPYITQNAIRKDKMRIKNCKRAAMVKEKLKRKSKKIEQSKKEKRARIQQGVYYAPGQA